MEGDLDANGNIETVLVLQGTDQTLIKRSEYLDFNVMVRDEKSGDLKMMMDDNPVTLAILSKQKDGYKLTAQNNRIIPRFMDDWYRWKHSVSLENKTLKVEISGKVSSGIMDNFGETKRIYKFQIQDSRFVLTEAEETFWFQAMLRANGRTDGYQKHDFTANIGFITSTVSKNKQPAKEESHKISNLISFENVSADSISTLKSLANVQTDGDLIGKYSYRMSIDEGRNTLDLIFELKAKNVAIYRNEQNGEETQKRFGTWTWSKKLSKLR
ncbi:MAG: hypothetical protein HC846_03120 [Blastocatellia bacterium]|nr:hypothetical protein [Blastocatellia bacterium]